MDTKTRATPIPKKVRALPLNERIRWARKSAGLSHDRVIERMGRSNRGHLIKIEQGIHRPGPELRNTIADALGVPRDLFDVDDDEEEALDDLLVALRPLARLLQRRGDSLTAARA